jgi:hypothetical protein
MLGAKKVKGAKFQTETLPERHPDVTLGQARQKGEDAKDEAHLALN